MNDLPTFAVKSIEEQFPELLRLFYPRIYNNIGTYHSPKVISAFLATAVAETKIIGVDSAPNAYRIMLPALEGLISKRVPMFFLAPTMLEALKATDFSDDILWPTMPLPYETAIFVLPKGGFVHKDDGETYCILYTRNKPGLYHMDRFGLPPVELQTEFMSFLALCAEKGAWYESVLTLTKRPTIKLRNMFLLDENGLPPKLPLSATGLDANLTLDDEEFLGGLGVILFGALMAMTARPNLLTKERLINRIQANGKPSKEFWEPNIIGKDYKINVQSSNVHGSHNSPKMHWRRGHFRNQAFGTGRNQKKVIWLEPSLIGA